MTPSFSSQYLVLSQLKEIEETAHYVQRDLERVPEDIRQLEASLATKRGELDAAKASFSESEKKLRATERELKDKEDALFKAEGKMMEVKTNTEYQAALKENEAQKKTKAGLEDKVLGLITALEEQKKALASVDGEFKTYESGILAQKKGLEEDLKKLGEQMAKIVEKRKEFTSQLDSATQASYSKLLVAKKVPVSFAESGRCSACNLQVRAQIYNEILGQKAVHRCANCSRILIVPVRTETSAASADLSAK
jgi:uncharacterized protein